ncbi:MAG: carboxypeptidase-like regulatory domain-containing protein [bacterium]|nr:carboxypeptidase-like regulatory domain-containing protein [bacterium]
MKKLLFGLLVLVSAGLNAQTGKDSNLIQFSGILVNADSLYPVPFANISVIGKPYGTYSSLDGYFSFVARKGDTIAFSHVEFKTSYYIIPDSLKGFKYSMVKVMTQDTFYLPGQRVMPMPNRATFDYAFVTKGIPDDDFERAKNNLELEAMKERAYKMDNDASEAYRAVLRNQMQRSYYAGGQIPPMNILNPFAWAQFFEAWKRGDFKTKKKR